MERYKVLEKFHSVNGGIQEYRDKRRAEFLKNNPQIKGKDAAAKGEKFSPTSKNILVLLLAEESMNQRNIAKSLDVSSQAVSETLKKLEQNECIVKIAGAQNNENIVKLTEKGVEIANKFKERVKKHAESVFEDLSDEELQTFYDLLCKMKSRS